MPITNRTDSLLLKRAWLEVDLHEIGHAAVFDEDRYLALLSERQNLTTQIENLRLPMVAEPGG